jgi:hypothetical protein
MSDTRLKLVGPENDAEVTSDATPELSLFPSMDRPGPPCLRLVADNEGPPPYDAA